MKKSFFSVFLTALMAVSANAQNLQLHYDFGRHIYSTEEKKQTRCECYFRAFLS